MQTKKSDECELHYRSPLTLFLLTYLNVGISCKMTMKVCNKAKVKFVKGEMCNMPSRHILLLWVGGCI